MVNTYGAYSTGYPSYSRGGDAPMPSSYPERDSFAQPRVGTYRGPLESRGYNEQTGQYETRQSKKATFKDVYAMGEEMQKDYESTLTSSHPMETVDFPNLFDIPDIGAAFISRILFRHLWPFMVMPLVPTDRPNHVWNEIVFNDTGIERVPEEGVPTLSTFTSMAYAKALVRWAKGAKIERTAYLQPKGKFLFWMQVEQMSIATSHAMIHNILCALAWDTERGSSTNPDQMQSPHVTPAYYEGPKTIATYFKNEIERTFQLNKRPRSIDAVVEAMKEDFTQKTGNDMVQPDRLIFFNGGRRFYDDLSKQSESYWLTGWKQGEMPNPLQLVTNGMTYCESFEVRQGDYNASHDPFDEPGTFGEFAYVNRSLWARQEGEYNRRVLAIKCMDKDRNSIELIDYEKGVANSGLWRNYARCVATMGQPDPRDPYPSLCKSQWEPWGQELFKGAVSYKDAMMQIGLKWYNEQKHRMATNAKFLEQVATIQSTLGFVPTSAVPPPPTSSAMPLSLSAPVDEIRTDMGDLGNGSGYNGEQAIVLARKHRKRRHEGGEEEIDAPTPPSSTFFRYLQAQPKGGNHMLRLAKAVVNESSGQEPNGFDNDAVAWQGLSSQIVGNQLVDASANLSTSHEAHKLPSTPFEKYLATKKQWDGQSDVDELFEKDGESLGWADVHEHNIWLYLDSSMRVQDQMVYHSAPLTLSAKNAVLFVIPAELLVEMVNGGNVLKLDGTGVKSAGAWHTHGAYRLAALQHSVNISAALAAIQRHLTLHRDERKLLHSSEKDKPVDLTQRELLDQLKRLFNVSRAPTTFTVKGYNERKMVEHLRAAAKLPPLPCQLPVKRGIEALNQLAAYYYDTPASELKDDKILHHCRPVLKWLADPSAKLPLDTNVAAATTAARRFATKLSRSALEEKKPISDQDRLMLASLIERSKAELGKYVATAEQRWSSSKNKGDLPVIGQYLEPMELDDLIPMWQHYLEVGWSEDGVRTFMQLTVEMYGKLMVQTSKRLSDWSPFQVFETWYLIRLSNDVDSTSQQPQIDALKNDLKRLDDTSHDGRINFAAGASSLQQAIDVLEARRPNMSGSLNTFRAHSAEMISWARASKSFLEQVSVAEDLLHHYMAPEYFKSAPPGIKAEVYEVIQELKRYNRHSFTPAFWETKNAEWAHLSDEVAAIAVQYVHHLARMEFNEFVIKRDAPDLWQRVANHTNDDIKKWSARDLPARIDVSIPKSVAVEAADRRQGDLIDDLLAGTSLHDCRLFHLMVQNDIEPFIGLLYMWPWIRFLCSTIVMVKDGLGETKYMEPDCLLSENGQQKLIYFHMSMYFKAMILKHRLITRAPFIYAKRYLGGGGHKMWNPTDPVHTDLAKDPVKLSDFVATPDIFVVPTRIDREVKAEYMSATGWFHKTVPLSGEDKATSRYELDARVSECWGWTVDRQPFPTEEPLDRIAHDPYDNMLLCRTHMQCYNFDKKDWTDIKMCVGHVGRNVYNGCMDAFNGKGFINENKCGTSDSIET